MQMTVTERDKKLLVMLACFLIFVGFTVYLILPSAEQINRIEGEISIADMSKLNVEAQMAQLPATEKKNGELKEEVQRLTELFYSQMSVNEIDVMLTDWIQEANMECVKMELDMSQLQEQVRSCTARMTLTGAEEDFYMLMDRINGESSAVVMKEADFTTETKGQRVLEVVVYMTEK